ncbi:MAG: hypothetical protein HRU08_04910 [Oleispira sp.]|nr:hypothetical protein [Oleispira sp.]
MRILILLISLSLSACADWQESLFEVGVDAERSLSNLSEYQVSTKSHDWHYLDSTLDGVVGIEAENTEVLILLHGFAVDREGKSDG